MATTASSVQQVVAETQIYTERIAALPFRAALAQRSLPRESYGAWLHAMTIVYQTLERELVPRAKPAIAALWHATPPKLPQIEQERSTFAEPTDAAFSAALLNAYLLASQMRQRVAHHPPTLAAYIYVLSGPLLNQLVPPEIVAQNFKRRRSRKSTLVAVPAQISEAQLEAWSSRFRTIFNDPEAQALPAVQEALNGLERILATLFPIVARKLPEQVSALNPRAGTHAIPDDLREIEAALRAGEQTWHYFPYYEWRFGIRGQDYTRSDSAWLVTLTRHTDSVVQQQIAWLGRVLASRGMPQWMLEVHLQALYTALVEAAPEPQERYATLLRAAEMLRRMRQEHLSDDVFDALSREFDARVGREWSQRLKRAGGLLVAAVADERAGIANAVSSLESWMIDPARFPPEWIAAVQHAIAAAREQAR